MQYKSFSIERFYYAHNFPGSPLLLYLLYLLVKVFFPSPWGLEITINVL